MSAAAPNTDPLRFFDERYDAFATYRVRRGDYGACTHAGKTLDLAVGKDVGPRTNSSPTPPLPAMRGPPKRLPKAKVNYARDGVRES